MVIELNDDIIILLLLKSYLLIFIPLRYICRKQNSGDTLNVMYRTVIYMFVLHTIRASFRQL